MNIFKRFIANLVVFILGTALLWFCSDKIWEALEGKKSLYGIGYFISYVLIFAGYSGISGIFSERRLRKLLEEERKKDKQSKEEKAE